MNRIIVKILVFLFTLMSLTACLLSKEKTIMGERNPNINKYVSVRSTDNSIFDNDFCYPKFSIKTKKETKHVITEYQFKYTFAFGQNLDIYESRTITWTEDSEELVILNRGDVYQIDVKLDKIPLETELDTSSYLGILNFTALEVIIYTVKIKK